MWAFLQITFLRISPPPRHSLIFVLSHKCPVKIWSGPSTESLPQLRPPHQILWTCPEWVCQVLTVNPWIWNCLGFPLNCSQWIHNIYLKIEGMEVLSILLSICLLRQSGLFICGLDFLVCSFLSQKEGPLHYFMCEGKTVLIFPTSVSISREGNLRDKRTPLAVPSVKSETWSLWSPPKLSKSLTCFGMIWLDSFIFNML